MNERQMLKKMVKQAEKIVFFGGAGVSTASGIPDFRGTGGLYQSGEYSNVRPEYILSKRCMLDRPELFFDYYRKKMIYPHAAPNQAHLALAELERRGKLTAVITQNIDGLHQTAGSETVYELHGSVRHNTCVGCGKYYPPETVMRADGVPRCVNCGGMIRPDVVLYGEGLDGMTFRLAEQAVDEADMMIVGGTSLTVYPAASLVERFHGAHLVILNLAPTPFDGDAALTIRSPVAEVLGQLIEDLRFGAGKL